MWETTDEKLVLLELLVSGTLKKRRAQAAVFDALAELPWTRVTGRRDEIALVEEHRHEIASLLDRVWPEWGASLAELTARGLPPTPDGWGSLEDARRAAGLPVLPELINRRTAAALAAPHSKATLTERRREALGDAEPTHDGTVRLRPPRGLSVRTERGSVDLSAVAGILGEVAIPERAFRDSLVFEGAVGALLLVENLGAWRDLPAPEGFLLAHVPGWDTATVTLLLERFTEVPVVHFGDLDPNGARIYVHLRERRPDLVWFVPPFWKEFVESHGQRGAWPDDLDLSWGPEFVRELARRELWLEQERIVLDPRLHPELESAIHDRVGRASESRAGNEPTDH